jgi:hypothetical protein
VDGEKMSEDAQCIHCKKWFSYEDLEQRGYGDDISFVCRTCESNYEQDPDAQRDQVLDDEATQ